MTVCWLCGRDGLDLTEGHIVPQRWGGRLTTRSCGDCNALGAKLERLAEDVPWAAAAVGRAGVRGRSGTLRRSQTKARYPDRVAGVVAYTPERPAATQHTVVCQDEHLHACEAPVLLADAEGRPSV